MPETLQGLLSASKVLMMSDDIARCGKAERSLGIEAVVGFL